MHTRDSLFRAIQATFTDGVVTIVGSGLSCAAGLPSMTDLADHLLSSVESAPPPGSDDCSVWKEIATQLEEGIDLETALAAADPSESLQDLIVSITGDFIEERENTAVRDIGDSSPVLPFVDLVPHIMHVNGKHADVITTNYDRILEFSIELAGFEVSTGHVGTYVSRFDPIQARANLERHERASARRTRVRMRRHIAIHKPHGSLDWRLLGDKAIRTAVPKARGRRLMITPGVSKYRKGYDHPFDAQIQSANAAIDAAGAFLVVGYGFNDDHLQTHLIPRISAGIPTLILARSLTPKARTVLSEATGAIGLECIPGSGTRALLKDETIELEGEDLWDLRELVKTVIQ